MTENTRPSPPVKLTPPSLRGVLARPRLFDLLDEGRKRPIIWVSAPAGAGKTTLIASYLQARELSALWYQVDAGDNDVGSFIYYMGIAAGAANPQHPKPLPLLTTEYSTDLNAFAVNYFRDLFERVRRPSVVVFDNFQDAQNDSFHQVLQQGFEQIPTDITAIVISREDPPSAFARARASERIALLKWEEMKLTEEESATLTSLRMTEMPSRSTLDEIYRRTQGWIAGLVLLTENPGERSGELPLAAEADQSIFDYFANEIFNCSSEDARLFLLRTAFLPTISMSIARRLADAADCEAILRSLRQRNFFTVRHTDGTYEYHPLFRSFLLNRIDLVYTRDEIDALKRRSADLLAEDGHIEMAVALLLDARDWQSGLALVLKHAHTLCLQGRSRTLHSWLMSFPLEFRESNPWASYWLGVCRLPFDPAQARVYFERAFAIFEKGDDASPLYLTWSRIIDSFTFELEDYRPMAKWLDRYPTMAQGYTPPAPRIEAASVFTYVSGLIHSRFGHPDLDVYLQRAELLLAKESERRREVARAVALIPYYLWKGDLTKMGAMLDKIMMRMDTSDGHVVPRLHALLWKSMHAATAADAKTSLQTTEEGLALGEKHGIHITDSQLYAYAIWGQLCVGNVAHARTLLDKLSLIPRPGRINDSIYQHYIAAVALHEGDINLAVEAARRAAEIGTTAQTSIGAVSHSIGLAFALAHRGELDEALALLLNLQPMTSATQSLYLVSFSALCEANIRHLRGEKSTALQLLREGFSIARNGGFALPAYCPRETASKLCAIALEHNIESEYVKRIISKMHLSPSPESAADRWPWPIKIYAVGRFGVLKDDQRLHLEGRAYQKPLALLQFIAGQGTRQVNALDVVHALWPDSDGDKATQSLRTTLYRLRKLIGEQCIDSSRGQLSLNPQYCWWDVRELETILQDDLFSSPVNADRLLKLVRGPLHEGKDDSWISIQREYLHEKVFGALRRLSEDREAEGNHESALKFCLKGIDISPGAEDLYRRAMRCHHRLGRSAAAIALYDRCKRFFPARLRMELSAETHALVDEIKQNRVHDR